MSGALARRAFKPVYLLYYQLLFGRRFPGAGALARRVRAWELTTARGDAPVPKDLWERQYREGSWAFMRGFDEIGRYAVIAAFAHRLSPAAAVLDVGCGEGLLTDHLRPLGYSRYLGVDVAEAAVTAAAPRGDARTEFVAADAEAYAPVESFDIVVFNECLYYFRDPAATVARYESCLTGSGAFLVSTFRSRRADAIVRQLLRRYSLLEETTISNRKGSWIVRVLLPPRPRAAPP